MKGGLRKELTLTVIGIVLLCVIGIIIISNIFINKAFEKYAQKQMNDRSDEIVRHLESQYLPLYKSWNEDYIHGLGMYALYEGYIIKLYNERHDLVWDAENHDMALMREMMNSIEQRMKESKPFFEGGFVTKSFPLVYDNQMIGTVEITFYGPYFYTENDVAFLKTLNSIFALVGILSILVAFLASRYMSKKMIKPILSTVDTAKLISEGNYKAINAEIPKSEELRILVTTMNQMAMTLDQQERLRKQLTTDVAHELRTPLTTVASHLEAMIEKVWEPTSERLQSCYDEIGRITGLVSDLEKLSKIEIENLKLNVVEFNAFDLLFSVKKNFELEALKKGIRFEIIGESTTVKLDKDRIYQVVSNIVSNAIHYTPEGGEVLCYLYKRDKAFIIEVKDTGIGISEEDLPYIFERFYRTDKSRSRRTGGSGIGLTIAKSIVLAHGGQIEVQSKINKGSQFTLKLPINID